MKLMAEKRNRDVSSNQLQDSSVSSFVAMLPKRLRKRLLNKVLANDDDNSETSSLRSSHHHLSFCDDNECTGDRKMKTTNLPSTDDNEEESDKENITCFKDDENFKIKSKDGITSNSSRNYRNPTASSSMISIQSAVKASQLPGSNEITSNFNETRLFPSNNFCESTTTAEEKLFVTGNHVDIITPEWLQSYENVNNKTLRVLLENLLNLNRDIGTILISQSYIENWNEFMRLRNEIQNIYTSLLENNMKFCCKENTEVYFWKILYYNVIEYLRACIKKRSNKMNEKIMKECLLEVIEDGYILYKKLIKELRFRYPSLQQSTSPQPSKNSSKSSDSSLDIGQGSSGNRYDTLAKVTAQTLLLHLGDLARYEEQMHETNNFTLAQNYYLDAQTLMPSNGIPYNQLALLSIYSNRKLDAVYYHMRSVMAANSIKSAKESLKVLFDEIRKKYDENAAKLEKSKSKSENATKEKHKKSQSYQSPDMTNTVDKGDNLCFKLTSARKEIWVHPHSNRRLYRITPYSQKEFYYLDDDLLTSLRPDDVLRRFVSSYLYIIGKLFTSIGMENFQRALFQMLSEFRVLISQMELIYRKNRLLQIILLNIFSIEHQSRKEGSDSRPEIRNHAFNMSSLMFGIIINQANTILRELIFARGSKDNSTIKNEDKKYDLYEASVCSLKCADFSEELKVLLQNIIIWCNWLELNLHHWNPLPSISNYNLVNEYEMCPWDGLAQLATILSSSVDSNRDVLPDDILNNRLEEDSFCDGFIPLSSIIKQRDTSCRIDTEEFKLTIRIERIVEFASKYLCHCSPPIFKQLRNDNKTIFVNIIKINDEISENESKNGFKEIPAEEDGNSDTVTATSSEEMLINEKAKDENKLTTEAELKSFLETGDINSTDSENLLNCGNNNSEISELLERKKELEEKRRLQEMYKQNFVNILQTLGRAWYLEVHPKYLVPDTNCFIDSLAELQIIAKELRHYILAAPLAVVSELAGLSKGFKTSTTSDLNLLKINSSKIHHFDDVSSRASKALEFIRSNSSVVKCVTTKGSILASSTFTFEESDEGFISNDDRILMTALSMSKVSVNNEKNGTSRILTSVVLLTTDRNLRVKALSRQIPVSELQEFLDWAKLEN